MFTMNSYLIFCVTLLVIVFTYIKWSYTYWKRRGIPYIQPTFPIGTLGKSVFQTIGVGEQTKRHYDLAKAAGFKYVGLFSFWIPIYLPVHPELLKNIFSKDFHHFRDRGMYYNEKDDPIGAHLFNLEGDRWKSLRAKLTPTFTTGKMKTMFPILTECSSSMLNAVSKLASIGQPVEIKNVTGSFTADVIGNCAFGLECNSFENPNSEFNRYGKKAFTETKVQFLQILLGYLFPNLARRLGIKSLVPGVGEFYASVVKNTLDYRAANNVRRNDFLQLISDLAAQENGGGLTFNEIASQCYLFFIAGYETSSTTMTFCLFELAQHAKVQERVRREISAVLEKHSSLTYEAIMEMKYTGQVIDETLRKYPPLANLNRICVADYKIPGSNSVIEKGTHVVISSLGIHRDSEYYPEPEKFDPERFSEENRGKILPFTYIPFGEGPRFCIASRFGYMQTKVGLAVLLKNFKFSLSHKTVLPLKLDPTTIVLGSLGKIWLDVNKV